MVFAGPETQSGSATSQSANSTQANSKTSGSTATATPSSSTPSTSASSTTGNPSMSNAAMSQSEKNVLDGKKFFEENKKHRNIKTLPSGLQYEVIQEGNGQSPGPSDYVTVHYRGTLLDGTEFDSSYARKEPSTFPVNAVIAGWTEALQLMKPGAKWRVYIPSQLAYGTRGAGRVIGPNAALIFDIELLKVKPSLESSSNSNMPDEEAG
jgi:FKBP-type peptidyl-prolyl cis-trans isomerase